MSVVEKKWNVNDYQKKGNSAKLAVHAYENLMKTLEKKNYYYFTPVRTTTNAISIHFILIWTNLH